MDFLQNQNQIKSNPSIRSIRSTNQSDQSNPIKSNQINQPINPSIDQWVNQSMKMNQFLNQTQWIKMNQSWQPWQYASFRNHFSKIGYHLSSILIHPDSLERIKTPDSLREGWMEAGDPKQHSLFPYLIHQTHGIDRGYFDVIPLSKKRESKKANTSLNHVEVKLQDPPVPCNKSTRHNSNSSKSKSFKQTKTAPGWDNQKNICNYFLDWYVILFIGCFSLSTRKLEM